MMRSDMPKENNTFIRASFTPESRKYRAENFMSDCKLIITHYFTFVKTKRGTKTLKIILLQKMWVCVIISNGIRRAFSLLK